MRCTGRETGPGSAGGGERRGGLGEGKRDQERAFFEAAHPYYTQSKRRQVECPVKLQIIKMTQDRRNEKVMSENLLQSLGLMRV